MHSSIAKLTGLMQRTLQNRLRAFQHNPYKDQIAYVRVGNELHPGERVFREKRLLHVKSALEKLLDKSLDLQSVPTIALVESGGGFRSLMSTTGWHVGLVKSGLMDAVTYMVSSSGSAISTALWFSHNVSIEQFKERLIFTTQYRAFWSLGSMHDLLLWSKALVAKKLCNQKTTLIDWWSYLGMNWTMKDFGNDRHRVYLSEQAKIVEQGYLPFPIYTALCTSTKNMYEFTPYEIGSSQLGMYVPSWAYGRAFQDGVSIDYAPEQSLGFLLGTFGSVFAVKLSFAFKYLTHHKDGSNVFKRCADFCVARIGHKRVTTAQVNNFTRGMQGSVLKHNTVMHLCDTAEAFSLPYAPVSGDRTDRQSDILLFLDTSADMPLGLHQAEHYARDKGLKFPRIDYVDIEKKMITIFKDEHDAAVPLVIYMPLVCNQEIFEILQHDPMWEHNKQLFDHFDAHNFIQQKFSKSLNTRYAQEDVQQLSALAEGLIYINKHAILEAIAWKMQQRNNIKSKGEFI
ncbi:MAG: hypothetical protein NTX86_00070 [Candidatus Dependentiae bacterium]|nr:hypothetical protein [Candidatus Dependentiae bacterium]